MSALSNKGSFSFTLCVIFSFLLLTGGDFWLRTVAHFLLNCSLNAFTVRSCGHNENESVVPEQILCVERLMIKYSTSIKSVTFEIKSMSTAPVNHYDVS